MPYIGTIPSASFTSLAKQDITGNGGTDYTLSNAVTNANDLAVFLNNVRQEPTEAYTASGTTLAMTGAINSSDNFYVIFLGQAIQTSNPPDGSVSTSQIANDSVTSAKTNFVSTSSVAGLQIKGDGTTDGTLQLNCSQNSHGIKLKSPNHGAGQSYTLTFPPTAPVADKALITDGSGNLSFGNAGGLDLLLNATISSAVAQYDISSTYINSTYDTYYLDASFHPVTDGRLLYMNPFVGGVIGNSGIAYANFNIDTGQRVVSDNATIIRCAYNAVGNAVGESISLNGYLQNINSTTIPWCFSGMSNYYRTTGVHESNCVTGGYVVANRALVVNGLRLWFSGSSIEEGTVKLYGLRK